MMKRYVGKETAELLGVFMNKIAPFWGNKGNHSESIKQFMPPIPNTTKIGQQKV